MAFSSTITDFSTFGNKRVAWGTFTNAGGDTGGVITTNLMTRIEYVDLQHTGTAVVADHPVVNGTFPIASATGAFTIVTTDGADGIWYAEGMI